LVVRGLSSRLTPNAARRGGRVSVTFNCAALVLLVLLQIPGSGGGRSDELC
jgi:hypothetical protein